MTIRVAMCACAVARHNEKRVKLGKINRTALLSFLSMVAACSQPPSMITGSSVDSSEYSHLDCEGLGKEQRRVKSELDQSQRLQRMYVAGDIASVLLVGVPPTAVTGSNNTAIARQKGELIAIGRSLRLKQCPGAPKEDPWKVNDENALQRLEGLLQ